ncbi:hypothetical protein B0H14DRAFT_2613244 [Mycena olivaceomarginata]|nr:hypothetical protein B0H14DRAFT_2613244 [Mycena olivaceomarginata]
MLNYNLTQLYLICAYEIGVLLSCVLFGVTTTQTYIYYSRFADDSRKLKGLVALVWVCEFAHALCIGHTLYFYTISGYNQTDSQVFSPRTLLAGFSITACIVACDTTMVESLITSAWVVGVANDLLITITLVFLLRCQRKDVHKRTMALADKIIAWTIVSVHAKELYACTGYGSQFSPSRHDVGIFPNDILHFLNRIAPPKVFANSFLASLNGRTTLRAMSDAPLTFTMPPVRS